MAARTPLRCLIHFLVFIFKLVIIITICYYYDTHRMCGKADVQSWHSLASCVCSHLLSGGSYMTASTLSSIS